MLFCLHGPIFIFLQSSCTLSFSPTNSSDEGPYAVQLMIEDFPRQNITLTQTNGTQTIITINDAISKMPVQFVVRGTNNFSWLLLNGPVILAF